VFLSDALTFWIKRVVIRYPPHILLIADKTLSRSAGFSGMLK
jgi:hypothetical protein